MNVENLIEYSEDLTSAYIYAEQIEAVAKSEGRNEEDVRLDAEQHLGCEGYDFIETESDGRMIFHKVN